MLKKLKLFLISIFKNKSQKKRTTQHDDEEDFYRDMEIGMFDDE